MISLFEMVREYLLDQPTIVGEVVARVWGLTTPTAEVNAMPRKAIRITIDTEPVQSLPTIRFRANLHCYGANIVEAEALSGIVYDAIKRSGSIGVALHDDTYCLYLCHCVRPTSLLYEALSEWPRADSTWLIEAEEGGT